MSRAKAAAGELSAAAQQTMRRLCDRRSACGRCPSCRSVLAVARRVPAAQPATEVPEATAEAAPKRPSVREGKPAWVDYAAACGMDRGTAEALPKARLVEQLP